MKKPAEKVRRRSRRALMVLVIVSLIAVPLFLFRTITGDMVDDITQSLSLQHSQELNAQMSAHISSTLDFYFHELSTEYDALKLIDDLDEEKLRAFICDIEENNGFSYLAFADEDGYVYEADGSYLGTLRVPMLGKLLSGTERIVTDNVTIGNNSYILVGARFQEAIHIGDKTIHIAFLGMDDRDLTEHVVLHSDYSGGYSSIIHTDGSYVIKNPAATQSGLNVLSILEKAYQISQEELSALKSAIAKGESYLYHAYESETDASLYLFFAPIADTEWYLVNTLPGAFIKNSIVNLRDALETVSVLFVAVCILVAMLVILQQMSVSRKLKKSHAELQQALNTARIASEAKTSFLFSMSHDIRTPMNAILGYTDIGLKHVENAELSRDSYQKIKRAGGHLLNLINDILEMSRIESGKMTLNEKPLDIRDAIADVSTMSQSLAIEKSIDFKLIIGKLSQPYIYADELHVNEVLINIISNAVKYTPSGGNVCFTIHQISEAAEGKASYRFEIADNGIGMSEDFQRRLFETFSREENSTIAKTEGTGLGLSIVKRIVDMSGGEIRVHSVQGQGSTFTVELPFRVMDEAAIEQLQVEKQKALDIPKTFDFAGKKVLLAEDNELNREIATCILEDVGLEVDCAEDGEMAVNAILEKGVSYYDFILMDIQMPVLNGYEATQKIRKLPGGGSIPIIALSANAFEEDKKKSLEVGMNGHVAKPIDVNVLLETLQQILGS